MNLKKNHKFNLTFTNKPSKIRFQNNNTYILVSGSKIFEKQTKLKVKLEKEEIVPRKNGEKSESGGVGETEDAGVFGRL